MTGIVKLNNVTKVIKGRTIIDSISFEVHKGEIFGFLGPNGAGKDDHDSYDCGSYKHIIRGYRN